MRGKKRSSRPHARDARFVPVVHRLSEEEFEMWYSEPCLAMED
ncbi:MAG TPA: hypothetical protein VI389_11615 [Geobacteraceae bacterium]